MKIDDYALIGDCHTAALVARDGSIDWLCWPRFDSPACFAALLGEENHGRWKIAPSSAVRSVERHYRGDTLVLETRFATDEGAVSVVDFMPVRTRQCDLVRLVIGQRGRVKMDMQLILRFDYGYAVPWVSRLADGSGIQAIAGPDKVVLRTRVPLAGKEFSTVSAFEVAEGEVIPFVMSHVPSHEAEPQPIDAMRSLQDTEGFWTDWASRCTQPAGPWGGAVRRSLITLKALTYHPTGGIVAAPTTSLPEQPGGVRNWDYRFCWLRDATLTLLALMDAGYYEEARRWREWLVRAVAGRPSQMQILYGIAGERRIPESTLDWLPGYQGAAPVRVGNAAASQRQLDVYGEVMDALYQGCKGGLAPFDAAWDLQSALLSHLEKVWTEPDESIWEVRGPPRHFTYSKVMSWVAMDRAVKAVEHFGFPGPADHWRVLRDRIHADVCAQGYDGSMKTFVQSYGSKELDASLLLIPITGFLPAEDPRVKGTIQAIQSDLVADGLVMRYRTRSSLDGLPPGEGCFLACSFWLADALVMLGRRDEARELFERLLTLQNDVGLLAEEYDPVGKRFLGNFPQAFSHVGLVNTAFNLGRREKPAEQRAEKKAA